MVTGNHCVCVCVCVNCPFRGWAVGEWVLSSWTASYWVNLDQGIHPTTLYTHHVRLPPLSHTRARTCTHAHTHTTQGGTAVGGWVSAKQFYSKCGTRNEQSSHWSGHSSYRGAANFVCVYVCPLNSLLISSWSLWEELLQETPQNKRCTNHPHTPVHTLHTYAGLEWTVWESQRWEWRVLVPTGKRMVRDV